MKNRNIYSNQSQELIHLFEAAVNASRVMCVPIDYAKKDHTVMFCNGHGDIIRKPFSIKNTPEGVVYLADQVKRSCHHRGINQGHVFFGGESVGSYADNFVSTLRSNGWLVASVNAHDAKKQRENMQASTDCLDLMGIARMLLNKRANCCPAQAGIYHNLRSLVRHRGNLGSISTEVKNQIHTVVDRLFPGFLDVRKSGIYPFSEASLHLMGQRFSALHIRKRKQSTLMRQLKRCGARQVEISVSKLQGYAAKVLSPSDEYVDTLQILLGHHVKHFRCLRENIEQLEKKLQ